jgi:hypothetical protein
MKKSIYSDSKKSLIQAQCKSNFFCFRKIAFSGSNFSISEKFRFPRREEKAIFSVSEKQFFSVRHKMGNFSEK